MKKKLQGKTSKVVSSRTKISKHKSCGVISNHGYCGGISKPATPRTREIMDYPFKGTISEARIKKAVKAVIAARTNK